MKLVLIPAGKFTMGSPLVGESPEHKVEITRRFYMGVYTVTQEEYEKVTGKNPSTFRKGGSHEDSVKDLDTKRFPVENASWNEAMAFCEQLNKQDATEPVGWKYDLPTEAEWEYACRAGMKTAYFFGDDPRNLDEYAWYGANSGWRIHEVGTKKPNLWGLYDMHGNACQWCADCNGPYGNGHIKDQIGPQNGDPVQRGGGWGWPADGLRDAMRRGMAPDSKNDDFGFRVVLRPNQRTP